MIKGLRVAGRDRVDSPVSPKILQLCPFNLFTPWPIYPFNCLETTFTAISCLFQLPSYPAAYQRLMCSMSHNNYYVNLLRKWLICIAVRCCLIRYCMSIFSVFYVEYGGPYFLGDGGACLPRAGGGT